MGLDLHFDPNELQVVIRSGTSKILSLCLLFGNVASDLLELPLASRHGDAITCHKMFRARCAKCMFQNRGREWSHSRKWLFDSCRRKPAAATVQEVSLTIKVVKTCILLVIEVGGRNHSTTSMQSDANG